MLDISYNVWINGSTKVLSYLTLIGDYYADTPLVLPSQFILVMNQASLRAVWNFTATADSTVLSSIGNALIVFKSVEFSGVVSPSGPSAALISCSNIPPSFYTNNQIKGVAPTGSIVTTGPDGIVSIGSMNMYFDGLTITKCGFTSANLALYQNTVVEVTRCTVSYGGIRGYRRINQFFVKFQFQANSLNYLCMLLCLIDIYVYM